MMAPQSREISLLQVLQIGLSHYVTDAMYLNAPGAAGRLLPNGVNGKLQYA